MGIETGQLRFMVVEDDPLTLEVYKMFLISQTHIPYPYPQPLDALREFRENPQGYDALLTDYQLPNMNGLELATEVRRIAPKIPTILSTGGNITEIQNRTPDGLIDFYLKKPFSFKVFVGTVTQLEKLYIQRGLPPR
jgi:two-component system cell cycle sensor histidine kinase/response regulator CckA